MTPGPFLPIDFAISALRASNTSAICFLLSPVDSAMLENSCNLVSGFSLLAAAFAIWSIPFANKQRTLEHYKRLKHNEIANLRGFEAKLQPVQCSKWGKNR